MKLNCICSVIKKRQQASIKKGESLVFTFLCPDHGQLQLDPPAKRSFIFSGRESRVFKIKSKKHFSLTTIYRRKSFKNLEFDLDNTGFMNCRLEGCKLRYSGVVIPMDKCDRTKFIRCAFESKTN